LTDAEIADIFKGTIAVVRFAEKLTTTWGGLKEQLICLYVLSVFLNR